MLKNDIKYAGEICHELETTNITQKRLSLPFQVDKVPECPGWTGRM